MAKKEFVATDEEVRTYREYAGRYKDFYELHKRWEQECLAQEEARSQEEEAIKSLVLTLREAAASESPPDTYALSKVFLTEVADTIEELASLVSELEKEIY